MLVVWMSLGQKILIMRRIVKKEQKGKKKESEKEEKHAVILKVTY